MIVRLFFLWQMISCRFISYRKNIFCTEVFEDRIGVWGKGRNFFQKVPSLSPSKCILNINRYQLLSKAAIALSQAFSTFSWFFSHREARPSAPFFMTLL